MDSFPDTSQGDTSFSLQEKEGGVVLDGNPGLFWKKCMLFPCSRSASVFEWQRRGDRGTVFLHVPSSS